jgi:hypothetical protein
MNGNHQEGLFLLNSAIPSALICSRHICQISVVLELEATTALAKNKLPQNTYSSADFKLPFMTTRDPFVTFNTSSPA